MKSQSFTIESSKRRNWKENFFNFRIIIMPHKNSKCAFIMYYKIKESKEKTRT